jgi:hypothetical protein
MCFHHKSETHCAENKIKDDKYFSMPEVFNGSTIVQVASCMFLTM